MKKKSIRKFSYHPKKINSQKLKKRILNYEFRDFKKKYKLRSQPNDQNPNTRDSTLNHPQLMNPFCYSEAENETYLSLLPYWFPPNWWVKVRQKYFKFKTVNKFYFSRLTKFYSSMKERDTKTKTKVIFLLIFHQHQEWHSFAHQKNFFWKKIRIFCLIFWVLIRRRQLQSGHWSARSTHWLTPTPPGEEKHTPPFQATTPRQLFFRRHDFFSSSSEPTDILPRVLFVTQWYKLSA